MNLKNKKIIYYVEGKCEEKVIDSIKNKYIISGKVKVLNITQVKLTSNVLRLIKPDTVCIIIFDVDVFERVSGLDISLVEANIRKLKKSADVIVICQQKNLEDEIVKATNVSHINGILNTDSISSWKREMIRCNNLLSKLEEKNFDIEKFWSSENLERLPKNSSHLIKLDI